MMFLVLNCCNKKKKDFWGLNHVNFVRSGDCLCYCFHSYFFVMCLCVGLISLKRNDNKFEFL